MDTEVEQREGTQAKKFSVPDDQDPMIALCYELVSSGRTFSEILEQAKRLPDPKAGSRLDNLEYPFDRPVLHGSEAVESDTRGVASSTDQTAGSGREELLPNFGDGPRVQAAAVWDFEDVGFAATSIPSVNLTP